jgi:hypothetical protein
MQEWIASEEFKAFRPAAQDDGVAGLEAKGSGVGGDVGAAS